METCPFCDSSLPSNAQTCPSCGGLLSGLELELGTVLIGKYTLHKLLGQGGFGITYLATDQILRRQVAIKELFPDGSTRQAQTLLAANGLGQNGFLEIKQRFLEEAQILAQFDHPNIVRVFEVFEANNTAYIVMEALQGETLGSRLGAVGKLPQAEIKRLGLALCDALEVVHRAGLLHRDLKPDNVFLTTDSRVVLIDFGSARTFQAGRAMRHTQLVSPGYAAPEQYASQAKFGTYTDVYGLAATLYHAATGQTPPTANDRFLSADSSLVVPAGVPEALKIVLARGLALRVQERPQTAGEFRRFLSGGEIKVALLEKKTQVSVDEQVLFRSNLLVITTWQIEVFGGSQSKKYKMSNIAEVGFDNDYWVAHNVNREVSWTGILFSIGFAIMGVVVLFASNWAFLVPDRDRRTGILNGLMTLNSGWMLLAVSIFISIFVVLDWHSKNQKLSYFLFITTRAKKWLFFGMPGERIVLYSSKNYEEVENLVQTIQSCLETNKTNSPPTN